jgi:hypothetical protein
MRDPTPPSKGPSEGRGVNGCRCRVQCGQHTAEAWGIEDVRALFGCPECASVTALIVLLQPAFAGSHCVPIVVSMLCALQSEHAHKQLLA